MVVNFHPELVQLMLEARYLDRKGFQVPAMAMQVALNEAQYREWQEMLANLLQEYYGITESLSSVERGLLSAKLATLELSLEPGLTRLNWNSRGVQAFVEAATKALQEFKGLLHSVQKSSGILEKVVNSIAACKLVADLPQGERGPLIDIMYQHGCTREPVAVVLQVVPE